MYVLSTKGSLWYFADEKKRSEEGVEGTIRSLGVNNFPNVAFMGVVTFIATHDANKKSFPSL